MLIDYKESYEASISDLQVMVAKADFNWTSILKSICQWLFLYGGRGVAAVGMEVREHD